MATISRCVQYVYYRTVEDVLIGGFWFFVSPPNLRNGFWHPSSSTENWTNPPPPPPVD